MTGDPDGHGLSLEKRDEVEGCASALGAGSNAQPWARGSGFWSEISPRPSMSSPLSPTGGARKRIAAPTKCASAVVQGPRQQYEASRPPEGRKLV